jgi:hypothetical protein
MAVLPAFDFEITTALKPQQIGQVVRSDYSTLFQQAHFSRSVYRSIFVTAHPAYQHGCSIDKA